jgi:RecB family exonuclease|tara:strand:- start:55 stop:729 length:675 start_codon:yes stop_codon:yes gene_type:complete
MSVAPWSFSRIKAFEQCPKQFYHMKILKEYEDKETDAMRYGTLMHEAAENYVKESTPLPSEFEYVRAGLDALIAIKGEKLCEYKMGLTESLDPCDFFAEDVWWRGIADLVILDEENKKAWVVDYKTGKSARYADKGQLELMALAVFKHFPIVEQVKAGLLFVVCTELVKGQYSNKDQTMLWDKWIGKFTQMQTAFEADVWNAKPSGLCRKHCSVLECVHNGRNQ